MRILIVEDADHLRKQIVKAMKAAGYSVDEAGNGDDGKWMAETYEYDALILDIMLPKLDGVSLLKGLRESGDLTPALFLTAMDSLQDRVGGLRSGADDYLVKPFELEELLARVEVLCRRNYQKASPILCIDDLQLNKATKTVTRAGVVIDITAKEFALLEYLLLREGQVVSKTEIEEHIYDDMVSPMSNVVETNMSRLRKSLVVSPDSRPLIHTRRGHGYILELR